MMFPYYGWLITVRLQNGLKFCFCYLTLLWTTWVYDRWPLGMGG
jgi:hypothetical protein